MTKKPYCGIGKVPKGKKKGNMKDCVKAKQIRKFGLNKIDSSIIRKKKGEKLTKGQLMISIAGKTGKKDRLIRLIKLEKNEKKKDKLKAEAKAVLREIKQLKDDVRKMQ